MSNCIQLKIELDDTRPKVWRRLLVSADVSFYKLHHVLQIAFGWKNYHLFHFIIDDYFIGLPDPEFDSIEMKTISAMDTTLGKTVEQGDEFLYEYDFGDSWYHLVKVEKVIPLKPNEKYPVCLAGERNAPPEDCGGVSGYEDLLKVLKNKKHPQRKEFIEWLGGEGAYDAEYFDLQKTNKLLAGLDKYIKKFEAS